MRTVPEDRRPVVDGDVARLPLTRGRTAILDAADVGLVVGRCWFAQYVGENAGFYAGRNGSRLAGSTEPSVVLLHRVILGVTGPGHVDHINHDTLDNRRANLRFGSHAENLRNRLRTNAASGYLGVYPQKSRGWQARIQLAGQTHHLGTYATPEAAALVRDEWVRENHPSPFWTYNFPRPGERGINREDVPA